MTRTLTRLAKATMFAALLLGLAARNAHAAATAMRDISGFSYLTTLAANDDGSTGSTSLGFGANFFGKTYSNLFINNNGNVTFDSALSTYTPFDLTSTSRVIIAPYFSDVDTRIGNEVRYGRGTVDGHNAFAVNWPGVGCYDKITTVLNYFQVILIDRSDVKRDLGAVHCLPSAVVAGSG